MKKLTQNHPKCMIKFKGKELIKYQIHAFKKAGIDDIAIVTGYKRKSSLSNTTLKNSTMINGIRPIW